MQLTPQQFLIANPIFNRRDLVHLLEARNVKDSDVAASLYVTRWQKDGLIKTVKRGLFISNVTKGERGLGNVEPIVIASRLSPDAIIGYHSAMEIHGFAQSLFENITFITTTNARPISFEGRKIIPVKASKALQKKGAQDRWVDITERGGIEIKVTSRARTVVDAFDRLDLCGGFEEVWRSCLSLDSIKLDQVEAYLKLLNCNVLYAKVGMFLERQKAEFLVPDELLRKIERRIPKSKIYVERSDVGQAKLIPRWNLMVPIAVTDEKGE